LTGMLDDSGYVTTSDDTGGLNAWVSATMGPATLIAEYVKVLDSISIDGVDTGFQPESLNLELGFALSDRVDVAGKIEKSRGVADWFAETRCGVVCNVLLRETDLYSTGLSLEYMHEEFDGGPDADLITMQLGLEF